MVAAANDQQMVECSLRHSYIATSQSLPTLKEPEAAALPFASAFVF